jgi:23S rRNA (adenine2030-N6)-methyltransferase
VNYRHHFHAGNFADLVKHAALTEALALLQQDLRPLLVIDTHAGAGAYELDFRSMREGEAAAAKRLSMADDAPPVFDRLKRVMREEAARVRTPIYPGSPMLVARALRRQDRLVACELREDDHGALVQRLRRVGGQSEALRVDGYAEAPKRLAQVGEGRALLLVDPPYERADDYARASGLLAEAHRLAPGTTALLWAPLKDLETLDRLVRSIEAIRPTPLGFVAETRLRPPLDPMKLNGCAIIVLNDPPGLQQAVEAASQWVAAQLGDAGASAPVWRLGA